MTANQGLRPVWPTSTGVIRAVSERLDTLERDLAAARVALAEAESTLVALTEGPSVGAPDALTLAEVGHLLGLSQSTVGSMCSRQVIRSVKIGLSRRVLRRDLDDYLASLWADGVA